MKKFWFLFLVISIFSINFALAASKSVNDVSTENALSSGELFDFKDVIFVINSSASTITGEKGSKRLHLVLHYPVSFIISMCGEGDGQDLDRISLVPSGLEKNFLLRKDSAFYIGKRDASPDAYLMFLDAQGKKVATRVDIEDIKFADEQMTAQVELEDVIPDSLVGNQTTKIVGLFIVPDTADISSDSAVYSRGNNFGAIVFDMLNQKGKNNSKLLRVKMKLKSK